MSILKLVSESTFEPVTVAELKTFLRIDSTDSASEDTLLASYITASRQHAENLTKRSLVVATRQLIIDDFDHSTAVVSLPRPPLSTASSNVTITYIKDTTAGDTTTVGSTVFNVDSNNEPGEIYPVFDGEWPDDIRDERNAVTIQYVSGYVNTSSVRPTPEGIKTWIKLRAGQMYEFREPLIDVAVHELPRSYIDGLLDPYCIPTVAT